jgi:signal transduction histidine kinase
MWCGSRSPACPGSCFSAIEAQRPYSSRVPGRAETQQLRLQSVTDAALAHLELDGLLAELLQRIRAILDVDTCTILLLDEEAQELVARASIGLEDEVARGSRIPVGRGFAGRVAGERRPIVLPDVEHADVLNPLLRERGVKSLLGVPLLVEGQPIGVLHVGSLAVRDFTQEEIDLLQLVADRAALAIEHAKLFEVERNARGRLERVQAVTDAALAYLELDELLPELLARIQLILDVDTCAILLLDDEHDELVPRASVGLGEAVGRDVRIPVGRGFAGRIAGERRPVSLPDVEHADVLDPMLREKGVKSLVGVPLIAHDRVVGVLHVGTLAPRTFTDRDTELLQLVAERAALAIEKSRLHDEMVRLDEMKLNFVAIASHELRTPASAVYGALMTLRMRGEELAGDARAELEETAFQQADRMRRLIEQLLDLSRLDARSVAIQPQPLVLRQLLSELVGGEDVTLNVDPGLAVIADPLVIDRVVTNLVVNARSYGRPPISIDAGMPDRYLRISVSDAGAGIPDELVPRLFERFERGTAGVGSGLGLAIARAYATAHGGELLYHSEAPGARFELLLPRL